MTQELYALGRDRSVGAVHAFLEHFVPKRESCAADYPVPELSDSPQVVFKSEGEILKYLADNPNEPYGLYWNDAESSSAQAMLFYTCDGNVIFGLAEETESPSERLQQLASFVGAEFSMLGSEQRPPGTTAEFIALCV